jgi:hypothetical protein
MTAELKLPEYAYRNRSLGVGLHPYLRILPRAQESPAMERVAPNPAFRRELLERARVDIQASERFAYIDVGRETIILGLSYYRRGSDLNLYLDLLHELTHLRQLRAGAELWDERFAYVDRPTEIEGYAVALEEGRRLGMSDPALIRHLSNPWMTPADVKRLLRNVEDFLKANPCR